MLGENLTVKENSSEGENILNKNEELGIRTERKIHLLTK